MSDGLNIWCPAADLGGGEGWGPFFPLSATGVPPKIVPLSGCLCQIVKDYLGFRDMRVMDIFADTGGAFVSPPPGHRAKGDLGFLFTHWPSTPVFWNDKVPSGHPRAFVQATTCCSW